MDIADINKVATKNKINADAVSLREKVSKETAKIIKLKVAQDTAYWDLKEKLHQLENNHERLQQNMVDVQMQHEGISAQYQEELRLRPETLNKVNSTREICSVLEEYSVRLKDTLTRCKADQVSLCDVYQQCVDKVKKLQQQQLRKEETHKLLHENLHDKVKAQADHHKQMQEHFESIKQLLTNEIQDLKIKLTSAYTQKDELIDALNNNIREVGVYKHECEKKEELISNFRNERQQLIREYNTHSNNMKDIITKQEKDLKECVEERDSLKKALVNSDEYSKSVCDQNMSLQEKISSLEEENITMQKMMNDLEASLKDASITSDRIERDASLLVQKNEELEKIVGEKNEKIHNIEEELNTLKASTSMLEGERENLVDNVNKTTEEVRRLTEQLAEKKALFNNLEMNVKKMEYQYKNHKEKTDADIKELQSILAMKDKELDSKSLIVNKLMSDVKDSSDARDKLEAALQKVKSECEVEKGARWESEKMITQYREQVDKLQSLVRNKDEELSKQMSIMLEMINEKERYQETIKEMQNKIDDIHKVSGRTNNPLVAEAEMDDNAVMTPARDSQNIKSSPPKKRSTDVTAPRSDMRQFDNLIYNIFSDNSVEGDSIDSVEVNRRFVALSCGESLPPVPVSALKRRNRIPSAQGDPKRKSSYNIDTTSVKNKERVFFKTKRFDNKKK